MAPMARFLEEEAEPDEMAVELDDIKFVSPPKRVSAPKSASLSLYPQKAPSPPQERLSAYC